MGLAEDIFEIKVDFPALGFPKSPTSAKTFSSSLIFIVSPNFPSVVFLGALLVDVLNLALPSPPFPPVTTVYSWSDFVRSQRNSSVSSLISIVLVAPLG